MVRCRIKFLLWIFSVTVGVGMFIFLLLDNQTKILPTNLFSVLNWVNQESSLSANWPSETDKILAKLETEEPDWQEITEAEVFHNETYKPRFFVYSAYVDFYENRDVIRLIAVTPTFAKEEFFAHLFDDNLNPLDTYICTISSTRGYEQGEKYSAGFFLCRQRQSSGPYARGNFLPAVRHVSVTPFPDAPSLDRDGHRLFSNLLRLSQPIGTDVEEPHKFAVCVPPAYDNFDNVVLFLEWLEFYKMMGVGHFTFYNVSTDPSISCVMNSASFNAETPATILKWTFPIPSRINSQLAQESDCAFRYRGVAKHIIGVDYDEFFVPNYTLARNYAELINALDTAWASEPRDGSLASYQFQSAFFDPDFSHFPASKVETLPRVKLDQLELDDMVLYRYVTRAEALFPYETR
ncbi:hypothetical protein Fcan01_16924 [Folsomia candida]|uniref:Glycosyltransferase family 92 protein n=2 Tax=Folsomia candida TaxID=158441 RepID=A0A226DV87_FOLCA|nr:hypothetical protein Fcan01_16924 [Folsomia candida]